MHACKDDRERERESRVHNRHTYNKQPPPYLPNTQNTTHDLPLTFQTHHTTPNTTSQTLLHKVLEALLALNLHEGLFALAKEKAIDAYRNVRVHVCMYVWEYGDNRGVEGCVVYCTLLWCWGYRDNRELYILWGRGEGSAVLPFL